MRKPLSLKHKVQIQGRTIDLRHTDLRATFARVRREMEAAARERATKVTPIKKAAGGRK